MLERPEEQLDLFASKGAKSPKSESSAQEVKKESKRPLPKPSRRIFDQEFMEKTFGPDYVPETSQESYQNKSVGQGQSQARRKFRPPYPQGYDGNPVIIKNPEAEKNKL